MKPNKIFLSLVPLMMLLFTACNSEAQNTVQNSISTTEAKIEVIQFHSEHRCMTCNKIEKLSREALKDYPNIPFSLVNVDEEKNEQKSEEFEAFGTALFLYNPATGEKKNLTEFAFMNAGNEKKFIEELKKEIQAFQKP
jgi:hypothetical protein